MIRTIAFLDDLPVDGLPPSALEIAVPGALFVKAQGYNAVDLAIKTPTDDINVAVFRYNQDFKGWRAEGPRGTTPTTFGAAFPDDIPIRISMPFVEEYLCIVTPDDQDLTDVIGSISGVNR